MAVKVPGDGKIRQELASESSHFDRSWAVFKDLVPSGEGLRKAFEPVEESAYEIRSMMKVKNHKGQVRAQNEATIRSSTDLLGLFERFLSEAKQIFESGSLTNYPDVVRKLDPGDGNVYEMIEVCAMDMRRAKEVQEAKGRSNAPGHDPIPPLVREVDHRDV